MKNNGESENQHHGVMAAARQSSSASSIWQRMTSAAISSVAGNYQSKSGGENDNHVNKRRKA